MVRPAGTQVVHVFGGPHRIEHAGQAVFHQRRPHQRACWLHHRCRPADRRGYWLQLAPRRCRQPKTPTAPHSVTVYVSNSAIGTGTIPKGDGLFVYKADLSDKFGQGNTARTGGLNFTTSADSPYRVQVGQDSSVYISDVGVTSAGIYRVDGNAENGQTGCNALIRQSDRTARSSPRDPLRPAIFRSTRLSRQRYPEQQPRFATTYRVRSVAQFGHACRRRVRRYRLHSRPHRTSSPIVDIAGPTAITSSRKTAPPATSTACAFTVPTARRFCSIRSPPPKRLDLTVCPTIRPLALRPQSVNRTCCVTSTASR